MALNSGKILMRRGQEVNFDPNKMIPGEWAVSLDSKFVRMCFSPGVCIRMATYESFEADMEQIREILAECQTVEEAIQRIYEDIKDVVVDVERIEAAAAGALESEENALNSANSAVQSANTATQKATEAAESANIASAKAEQATEGANTATQKASEAAENAENVRNMSVVSQSYAVGGTGTREGEDTDNAKFYNEQSMSNAERAEDAADRAAAISGVDIATVELAGLVKPDGDSIKILPDGTIYSDTAEIEKKLEETTEKVNIIVEKAELNIKDSASGENIHLTDSADSKAVEFALYGKATQETATGAQLLNYELWKEVAQTQNGSSVFENNGVTITAIRSHATIRIVSPFPVVEGDIVTISWEESTNADGNVVIANTDNSPTYVYVNNKSAKSLTYTVPANFGNIAFRFMVTNAGDTISYKNIMINKGAVALPYEPYTGGIPSPNPDYPQEIEVAGTSGNVLIKSCGKNLINQPDVSTEDAGSGFWIYGDIPIDANAGAKKIYLRKGEYMLSFKSNIERENSVSTDFYNEKLEKIFNVTGAVLNGYNEFAFTLEEDVYAIRSYTNTAIIISEIQIEKGLKRTSYEPYKETSFTISTPNGLAGIPVASGGNYTDENGQQWVCDEIVKYADGSGEYIQRVKKIVFDGSEDENWGKSGVTNNNSFYIVVDDVMSKDLDTMGLMCNRFTEIYRDTLIYSDVVGCSYGVPDRYELRIGFGLNSNITTADLLKEWLSNNNVEMLYRLANPIRTPLTSEEVAEIEKLRTFYPVTNISNDSGCGMRMNYLADSKNYIDNQLALQAQAQEAAMINMFLLLPDETQAAMIENDTNNLLTESEV